jgi:predicted nucleotidyltransferase
VLELQSLFDAEILIGFEGNYTYRTTIEYMDLLETMTATPIQLRKKDSSHRGDVIPIMQKDGVSLDEGHP